MNLPAVRTRIRNATPARNDASSIGRSAVVAALALTVALPAARAQDTARARVDSLAARVERAEERIKFLEQQLATESQSSVHTRSRMALEFRGRVLVNAFTNSRRVNSTGNPQFVRADDATDPDPRGIAMHLRQTMLGFAVTAKHVAGGDFLGDIDVDFHGGQLPSTGGRNFPVVRLRTARAIVMWSRAELLMGQDAPLVAGINPVSLAALATPEFAAAGNLWLWLPQVRGTVELGGPLHAAIQGAVLAPTSATPVGSFDIPDFDAAERSKRPFFEGRARIRWGHDETAGEIGVGGHIGWFASSPDTVTTGRLAAFDAIVPFSSWLELRAEAYNGAGARGLGGGAIGQLFGLDAKLIRSRGGWAQLNARPSPAFVFGAGYGVDDPRDADMAATARLKNDAMSVHAEWRPAGPLVFGAEVRRLRTWYETRRYANDHINLAFGFEF